MPHHVSIPPQNLCKSYHGVIAFDHLDATSWCTNLVPKPDTQ